MNTGLTGKIALVCAASRGLGKAAALGLAAEGARVAICARSMPALEETAGKIQADTGAEVLAIAADLGRRADVVRVVEQTAQHFGGLDILVTNSGGPKAGLFSAITESDWRQAIDDVLMSTVLLCMEAVPYMRRRGGGRIINITSTSAKQPIAGLMLSNALRPAVTGFSKTLANELARDGILVNCIAPGYTGEGIGRGDSEHHAGCSNRPRRSSSHAGARTPPRGPFDPSPLASGSHAGASPVVGACPIPGPPASETRGTVNQFKLQVT